MATAKKSESFVYRILFQFFLATLVQPANHVFAQEIIVEASSIDERKIEPSRSTSIVTENEIRAKNPDTVADLLRDIPGVEVVRQGGVGQTTSVFIRGARSEDTLILIDGVEANDAMSPAGGFDFSGLPPDHIARIEVYRGPQSVRFGAGALGGVINIVTKEGAGNPLTTYSLEGGSHQSSRVSLENSGGTGRIGYSIGVNRFATKGFSAASAKDGNSEADGAEVQSTAAKVSWLSNQASGVEGTIRYMNAKVDIDRYGGTGGDDPNNSAHTKQLVTGVSGSHRFFDDRLKSTLGLYYSEVDRTGRNIPDAADTTDSSDHFLSENKKIQTDHELTLGEYHTFRAGIQWRTESGLSDSSFNGTNTSIGRQGQSVLGESLTYLFESKTWFFDVGARSDLSSKVGSISSYRTSFGRQFPNRGTKAFVSYGTGFKLPSLYQLHSLYGDKDLHQEESSAIEGTLEQSFSESVFGSVTFFENNFHDLIDYNMSTNKYFNISKAKSKGFEARSTIQVTQSLKLDASYAYIDTEDKSTGLSLLRRPRNAWTLSTRYETSRYEIHMQYRFKGPRADVDPTTFQRIRNGHYDILNIGGSYRVSKLIRVTGRAENIFNKEYEEVAGYGTPRISFYVGISGEI